MDLAAKNPKSATPMKDPHGIQSKLSENSNPNVVAAVSNSSPCKKPSNSPLTKSAKSQKLSSKSQIVSQNPVIVCSPRNKIRERKFVVAKKNSKKEKMGASNPDVDCKCKEKFGGNVKKCLCMAYETLRASQEEFFKIKNSSEEKEETDKEKTCDDRAESEIDEEEEIKKSFVAQNHEIDDGYEDIDSSDEVSEPVQAGSPTMKRRRERLLEEARSSVPMCGKVKHLVKAFEEFLTISTLKEVDKEKEKQVKEDKKKAMQWALPGLQPPKVLETEDSSSFTLPMFEPPNISETQVSSSSFCPSDLFLTSENLGLDSRFSVSSSWDGSQGSISSRTSSGGRRSRRNSSESCGTMGGRRWKKKQLKATCQKPFNLRTEQRGKMKEEDFTKKVQERMIEEEKQRIPIAQGLPWTTDEPECLIKPPVKESTRPIDIKLHSDIRAVERAEFDQQVAEKISLIDQYKMERERQQQLAEEEEIRRLRKELVPKAQPMPYFDRPFVPRRSMKHPTVPKEPKFHIPQQKKIKCCVSWNDMSSWTYQ